MAEPSEAGIKSGLSGIQQRLWRLERADRQGTGEFERDLAPLAAALQKLLADVPRNAGGQSTTRWKDLDAETRATLSTRVLRLEAQTEALDRLMQIPTRREKSLLLQYAVLMALVTVLCAFLCLCKGHVFDVIGTTAAVTTEGTDGAPDEVAAENGAPPATRDGDGDPAESPVPPAPHPAWVVLALMCLGATGGSLRLISSLVLFLGEDKLLRRWLPYYYLMPVEGALLAPIVCLLVAGNLLEPEELASKEQVGLMLYYSLAGFSGLFAKNVMRKLKDVADATFGKPSTADPATGA
jgi:hypothetical protein